MSSLLQKGDTILVTGVNGYIASHVADQLLSHGYNVRGTVRKASKADWTVKLFDEKYGAGRFEVVEVPDMGAEGAFDEAIKGVQAVAHVASNMDFSRDVEATIPPVVRGTTNILDAAGKEEGIKSVVYTSSSTAAVLPMPGKKLKITVDTWDDAAVEAAYKPGATAFEVYGASKTEAERAFWKVIRETDLSFQAVTILPNANVGPILKPGGEMEASTASWFLKLYYGVEEPEAAKETMELLPPQWYCNVQDTARLIIIGLTDPEANGKRLFDFAGPFNWSDVLDIYRKLFPGNKFLDNPVDELRDEMDIPNQEAEALLKKHYGKGFVSLEDSLKQVTTTLH